MISTIDLEPNIARTAHLVSWEAKILVGNRLTELKDDRRRLIRIKWHATRCDECKELIASVAEGLFT